MTRMRNTAPPCGSPIHCAICLGILGGVVATGVIGARIGRRYRDELRAIRAQLAAESTVIQTSHGPIEYAAWGDGVPSLVLHGAGGGYDQGLLLARTFGSDGVRWICPSRFGYLRTPLPADASTMAQADAHAALLDALGIERVAILAMSGGVPSALQFGLRYPRRTIALVLLSPAPYTPLGASSQYLPVPLWVYHALFSSDFPYWLLQQLVATRLEALFDVTPARRAMLTAEEQAVMASMFHHFQPVTARRAGLANEGAATDPRTSYPIETLTAPTLVVHAQDDGINPFSVGEYTARQVPGATFLPLATGGHLLLGHHAAVRDVVNDFLRRHVTGSRPSGQVADTARRRTAAASGDDQPTARPGLVGEQPDPDSPIAHAEPAG